MKILHLPIAALLSILPTLVTPSRIECFPAEPLAPEPDCRRVLRSLDIEWQSSSKANRIHQWGRDLHDSETDKHLPFAYVMNPIRPGTRPDTPKCEFFIDNRQDRPHADDAFRLEQVSMSVKAALGLCYPLGKTGIVFPTHKENVYIEIRYRKISSGGRAVDGSSGLRNDTVVPLGVGDGVVALDGEAIS